MPVFVELNRESVSVVLDTATPKTNAYLNRMSLGVVLDQTAASTPAHLNRISRVVVVIISPMVAGGWKPKRGRIGK